MAQWIYDGTFDGLLCALAEALRRNAPETVIEPEGRSQSLLFSEDIVVRTDEALARATAARICTEVSRQTFRNILHVHLSELPELGSALYQYVKAGMEHGRKIDHWHAAPHVQAVHQAARKTSHEIHRLKGLVRFRELEDGLLWAPIEPDHQIIVPLALHFQKRLARETGIIHDVRRCMAVRWTHNRVDYIDPPELQSPSLAAHEADIQALWKTYFRSATLHERINPRQQKGFMPARYWKWLTETALPD